MLREYASGPDLILRCWAQGRANFCAKVLKARTINCRLFGK